MKLGLPGRPFPPLHGSVISPGAKGDREIVAVGDLPRGTEGRHARVRALRRGLRERGRVAVAVVVQKVVVLFVEVTRAHARQRVRGRWS